MEIGTITQLITQMGFPIAVCLVLFWYVNKKDAQHREEIDKLGSALQNNTSALNTLIDLLKGR